MRNGICITIFTGACRSSTVVQRSSQKRLSSLSLTVVLLAVLGMVNLPSMFYVPIKTINEWILWNPVIFPPSANTYHKGTMNTRDHMSTCLFPLPLSSQSPSVFRLTSTEDQTTPLDYGLKLTLIIFC